MVSFTSSSFFCSGVGAARMTVEASKEIVIATRIELGMMRYGAIALAGFKCAPRSSQFGVGVHIV
jgi:hypothetical protein